MKKQLLVTVLMMIPAMSFAKVADFNALIKENAKAQGELHTELRHDLDNSRQAINDSKIKHDRVVIVENSGQSYTAHGKKDLLKFDKEKTQYAPSQHTEFNRVANEVHNENQ